MILTTNDSMAAAFYTGPSFRPIYRWDNLENNHWNSTVRLAKVGHDKLLTSVVWVAPLLGTIASMDSGDREPGNLNALLRGGGPEGLMALRAMCKASRMTGETTHGEILRSIERGEIRP